MAIIAIVFDLDGTIAGFNLDYKAVRLKVCNLLISAGMPASILATERSTFEMIRKAKIFMKNKGRQKEDIGRIIDKALETIEKHEIEAAKTTSLLPGVKGTLQALRRSGIKIGLCTLNGEASTEYILGRFGIRSFFDAVVPRNKITNVKPNSEHLKSVLTALGVEANEAIFVGDGVNDMECARSSGVVAVGLLTGVSMSDELIDAGASYIITQMSDLPKLIIQMRAGVHKEGFEATLKPR